MRVDLEIRNGRIARLAPVGSAPAAAIQLSGGLVWPGFVDFKGLLQFGHCCSLAVQDDAFVDATLNSARDVGIAIVSLPMCPTMTASDVEEICDILKSVLLTQKAGA